MKWADYCVSKLSLTEAGMIDNVLLCKDLGESLDNEEIEKTRAWMVQQVDNGKTFCSIKRNKRGSWNKIGDFSYDGNIFEWYIVPQNITRRKTFVSYYHHDDQAHREIFENLFGDLVVSKSVDDGDIDSDNSADYIKQLIQREYLSDTTVLIVLIGAKTKGRKHVDWEIAGALNYKVGDNYAGVLGIFLPSHPDYGSGKYHPHLVPIRLAENFKSGYAIAMDWTDDRTIMQRYIEKAFNLRSEAGKIVNRTIPQMQKNTLE